VALLADPMGICVLNVRDDGVGVPVGLDFRQIDSLGLQLVCLLIEQLRGTIEVTRDHGAHWRLTFPVAICQARREEDGSSSDPDRCGSRRSA